MAGARRKTTIEERREIVKYCIEHNRNYKETAGIYDVSYSQAYSWVKKYDANGEEAGLSGTPYGLKALGLRVRYVKSSSNLKAKI